jgi:Rps23 Pro-64 3,4-dihydroxylase Tpa1-like proline 4-hydroxylase
MAQSLFDQGYYTSTNFLSSDSIQILRDQSIALRKQGRFEPSWSEKIVNGSAVRFDKKGVYACEPDGKDYYTAPDLITYMSVLLQTLPGVLNDQPSLEFANLSNQSFNAKLAVTCPGGFYPLHIDNPQGLSVGDTRKLTCILYLNPEYKQGDGGELRLVLSNKEETLSTVDLSPESGRILLFWSDEIPHEVLPSAPNHDEKDESLDRYALTIWIPTSNISAIHNDSSKFSSLKDIAFP